MTELYRVHFWTAVESDEYDSATDITFGASAEEAKQRIISDQNLKPTAKISLSEIESNVFHAVSRSTRKRPKAPERTRLDEVEMPAVVPKSRGNGTALKHLPVAKEPGRINEPKTVWNAYIRASDLHANTEHEQWAQIERMAAAMKYGQTPRKGTITADFELASQVRTQPPIDATVGWGRKDGRSRSLLK